MDTASAPLDLAAWLAAQGLPTRLLTPGSAAENPARFAAFLLRSPASLTAAQRRTLAPIAAPWLRTLSNPPKEKDPR